MPTSEQAEADVRDVVPVAVVVPAHDREVLLERALRSVASQTTVRPTEIVVVDDGSTDDTAGVAERLGARVIRHERNRGAAAARNTGLAAASTPWVAMLDSDDEWLPHHLSTLWALRGQHDLIAGSMLAVPDGEGPVRYHGPLSRRPMPLGSPAQLYPENFIPASGVLLRRAAVLDAGGYDTGLGFAEDLDLWIRMIERGSALATPTVVTRYGVHVGQKSRGERSRATQLAIVERYRSQAWCTPRVVELQLTFRAWDALRAALLDRHWVVAWREGKWLLGRPTRLTALGALLTRRWRVRRASSRLRPDGSPSVAVLSASAGLAEELTVRGELEGPAEEFVGLAATGRALARFAQRPVGLAMTDSSWRLGTLRSVVRERRRVRRGGAAA